MKKIYLLTLLVYTSIFSQVKEIKSFDFKGKNIEYTIIDYSKYSVAQLFITIYNDTAENASVEENAINCLSDKKNLYHTFYYFLKIPTGITDETEKTELYAGFLNHLSMEQDMQKHNLFLNFDADYTITHPMTDNIKRIITAINSNTICNYLSIR